MLIPGVFELSIITVFFLPAILILLSKKVSGGKKIGWFILGIVTSWIGYALFQIVESKQNPLST